jgi:putative SOS response-associated peptidase YedK
MFPKKPPCFDTLKQYQGWQRAAWETGLNARFGFCEDCTPNYKAEMLNRRRCIRPDSGFREDEDGFPAGYVPLRPSPMARKLMAKAGFWKN